ncbi:MAG: 50S ribosomal protein L15 [Deltaproteobacteria bacterium]|nr:50S ribosomal protein L15 [Deltaproteobacteria bacterium]
MLLNTLRAPRGAAKKKTRLGRGDASGQGSTSGKGHKGQKARSGGYHKVGYEGGQMPLARRLPKRGFTNIFKTEYAVVNIADLNMFAGTSEIDLALIRKKMSFKRKLTQLKVLGNGDLQTAMTVKAAKFSKSAVEKIEKAGGKVVVVAS